MPIKLDQNKRLLRQSINSTYGVCSFKEEDFEYYRSRGKITAELAYCSVMFNKIKFGKLTVDFNMFCTMLSKVENYSKFKKEVYLATKNN